MADGSPRAARRGVDAPLGEEAPPPSWLDRLSGLREELVGKRDRDAPRDNDRRHRAAIQGAQHGATFGLADDVGELIEPGAGEILRANENAARKDDPNAFLAGDLTGGMAAGEGLAGGLTVAGKAIAPAAAAALAAAPETAQAAFRTGRAAAEGAGQNVAQAVGDQAPEPGQSNWLDRLWNAKSAGLWGAAIPVAGMAAGKALGGAKRAEEGAEYFYHATPKSNLDKIRSEGLKPREGGKNFAFKKNKGVVYFGREADAPMWAEKLRDTTGEDVARLRTASKTEQVPGANEAVRVSRKTIPPPELEYLDPETEQWGALAQGADLGSYGNLSSAEQTKLPWSGETAPPPAPSAPETPFRPEQIPTASPDGSPLLYNSAVRSKDKTGYYALSPETSLPYIPAAVQKRALHASNVPWNEETKEHERLKNLFVEPQEGFLRVARVRPGTSVAEPKDIEKAAWAADDPYTALQARDHGKHFAAVDQGHVRKELTGRGFGLASFHGDPVPRYDGNTPLNKAQSVYGLDENALEELGQYPVRVHAKPTGEISYEQLPWQRELPFK